MFVGLQLGVCGSSISATRPVPVPDDAYPYPYPTRAENCYPIRPDPTRPDPTRPAGLPSGQIVGERGGTAFPFRFWRGNAVPLAYTTAVWVDAGERGVPPRPLHHQLKSKYTDNYLLGSLKFCYTLMIARSGWKTS